MLAAFIGGWELLLIGAALCVMIQERGCHLTAASIVDTDEQDLGNLLHDLSSRLRRRPEPLSGEPLRQDGDVGLDRRVFPA